MSFAALAVVAFFAALALLWIDRLPKVRIVLMIVAGLGFVGGLFARLLIKLSGFLLHFTTVATAKLFAVAVPVVLLVVALIWLAPQLHRKNSSPHKYAMWVGLLIPSLMLAAGGTFAHLEVTAKGGATEGGNALLQTLNDFVTSWSSTP